MFFQYEKAEKQRSLEAERKNVFCVKKLKDT